MSDPLITICVYHRVDTSGHRFSFMTYSDGTACPPPPAAYGNWYLYDTFYAFSPMLRPIPEGLKLIRVRQFGTYPYSTEVVQYNYDPFDVDDQSIYFLTWTQPVPHTSPLYLWRTNYDATYATFDATNLKSEMNWDKELISPVFVLRDRKAFKGNFGRCIPAEEGKSMVDCFLEYEMQRDGPATLHGMIRKEQGRPKLDAVFTPGDKKGVQNGVWAAYWVLWIASAVIALGIFWIVWRRRSRA